MFLKGELNMASRKFRFVSPGVFLKEVDNSQLPGLAEAVGPVIIGRTRKGPSLQPYKVRSLEEFERVFGKPMPGNQGEDPWRDGTHILAESYAPFAAKAYLTADIDSPVTVVRLAGVAGDDARAIETAEPGWKSNNAWGLLFGDNHASSSNQTLGAIFYGMNDDFKVQVRGLNHAGTRVTVSGSVVQLGDNDEIEVVLTADAAGAVTKDVKFVFSEMRKEFNTNPVATNLKVSTVSSGTLSEHYWLGETFDEAYKEYVANVPSDAGAKKTVAAVKLGALMNDFKSGTTHAVSPSRSGWVFGQDTSGQGHRYNPDNQEKLFRFIALHQGIESNKLIVGIEDIQVPREGSFNPYGTFSVVVKQAYTNGVQEIERFDNCDLNPNSQNFIAKMIGDQYFEWSRSEKRNKVYGSNPNISEYIRVEMNENVANAGPNDPSHVPFGFYGPVIPKAISGHSEALYASGSIRFVQDPGLNSTITITSADGTEVTYSGKSDANAAGRTFDHNSGLATAASTLVAAINNPAGHNGKILASVDGGDNQRVLLVNTKAGTSGNTTIVALGGGGAGDGDGVPGSGAPISASHLVLGQFAGGRDPASRNTRWLGQELSLTGAYGQGTTLAQDLDGAVFKLSWPSAPLVSKVIGGNPIRFGTTPYSLEYSSGSVASVSDVMNKGYCDTVRRLPTATGLASAQTSGLVDGVNTDYAYKFSLDEVVLLPVGGNATGSIVSTSDVSAAYWLSGSRSQSLTKLSNLGSRSGRPLAPVTSSNDNIQTGSVYRSWTQIVDAGVGSLRTLTDIVDGFDMPMVGGFDGVDITEANPFNNRVLRNGTTATNYAFASVDRALELIKDPEAIEHNLAVMPGVTNSSLTTKLVNTCESRADSLAIIDLPDIYIPPSEEKCSSFKDRVDGTTPERTAAALVRRQINSSYGATYYPWVKIKDEDSNRDVWVPPSVVALGVMAYTEKRNEVWFAPAGFNRGGLNQGTSGLPVLQVSEQLLSKDRDTLYQANINPVASFVSEGIVIFGQKTLQSTQSALDRINVRRLLIFVKKEVSRISNRILFEQNLRATWLSFKNQVEPFLDGIRSRFGLADFKVVLDETTTTPDLVDRNILYAKIFLKPARSIEFIAVDFVITRSGASFADPLE